MAVKLNDKQAAFCREYLIDLNGTQAAIRAGYSERTANRIASQLLSKLDVQTFITKLKNDRNQRVETDYDWVLTKAKESFLFNAQQVQDNEGNPKMVNATAAGKFLELCGKHTKVKAFEREEERAQEDPNITINIVEAVKPE